jgi:hypothetical protein
MPLANGNRRAAILPRRLGKRIYRAAVGPPVDDPVRAWRGTASYGLPSLRVLHVGDCGVRRMDGPHDLYGPPGYPKVAADLLLQDGIGIEFSHYFAVRFEHLPEIDTVRRHTRLSGQPDVVLVQIGSAYTRKILLPDQRRVHQLRDEAGRRAGSLVRHFYRVLRPCLRAFGRHSARYAGTGQLERFLDDARQAWPAAEIVLVTPFRRSPGYAAGEPIATRLEDDLHALARSRRGVSVFDCDDVLGRDPGLRCVTGYNLNGRGCELVGEKLAAWIRERPELAAKRQRSFAGVA